jgi:flagellar biosynthetic protein FliR
MTESEMLSYLWSVALVSIRVSSLFLFFPFFSSLRIPMTVKIASCFVFSIALLNHAKGSFPADLLNMQVGAGGLVLFIAREFVIGAGMGLVAKAFFQSCLASADWIGTQIGFNMGAVVDPQTETQESSWGIFHDWLAMMVYLALGGHWWSLQAIADSYTLNSALIFTRVSDPSMAALFWIEIGKTFFIWMLKLAGPMLAVVLFLQFSLGVLSKFVPQINLWSVSIPVTLGLGVFAFSMFSPMYGDILSQLFQAERESLYMWLKFLGR